MLDARPHLFTQFHTEILARFCRSVSPSPPYSFLIDDTQAAAASSGSGCGSDSDIMGSDSEGMGDSSGGGDESEDDGGGASDSEDSEGEGLLVSKGVYRPDSACARLGTGAETMHRVRRWGSCVQHRAPQKRLCDSSRSGRRRAVAREEGQGAQGAQGDSYTAPTREA